MVVQISSGTTVPAGGTLYGGYLMEPQDLQNAPSMSMLIGGEETTPWNSTTLQVESASARMPPPGSDNGATYVNGGQGLEGSNFIPNSGTALTNAGTYLVLFKVQNVNGTSGPVSMNQWILTDAQYQHFASNLTAAALILYSAASGTIPMCHGQDVHGVPRAKALGTQSAGASKNVSLIAASSIMRLVQAPALPMSSNLAAIRFRRLPLGRSLTAPPAA